MVSVFLLYCLSFMGKTNKCIWVNTQNKQTNKNITVHWVWEYLSSDKRIPCLVCHKICSSLRKYIPTYLYVVCNTKKKVSMYLVAMWTFSTTYNTASRWIHYLQVLFCKAPSHFCVCLRWKYVLLNYLTK